mmetsp:Transcript_26554/g.67945  ORF Transcript_26554/g.67945 Transcript_26554/m.67945 type:complete len:284 (+) Transcript_26554:1381-2232(+)
MLEGSGRRLASRLRQLIDKLPCIHSIQQVDVPRNAGHDIERQLAAVHGAQASRQLMRITAVLQWPLDFKGDGLCRRRLFDLGRHPLADCGIVGRGQGERGCGQVPAEGQGGAPLVAANLLHELLVLAWVRHDSHMRVVLRRGTDHARPADVDVLDAIGEVATLGHGLTEGVQVDDHEVDGPNAVLLHLRLVLLVAAGRQQGTVHLRVQRLHAAVQNLGRAGVVGHVLDRAAVLPELGRRAACGQDVDLVLGQELAQLLQARLVVDRDECCLDLNLVDHLALHS